MKKNFSFAEILQTYLEAKKAREHRASKNVRLEESDARGEVISAKIPSTVCLEKD